MNSMSFNEKRIAEGYAKDRPWLHKAVIDRLKRDLTGEKVFEGGLDIGCGAGLSSKALGLICENVTGIDISEEMIEVCKQLYDSPKYHFRVSNADDFKEEKIKFDIVTAAGVINWVNREQFLGSMHGIMNPKGLLLIYDFWITDIMSEIPAYTAWWNKEYLMKFPKPPRNEEIWRKEQISPYFQIISQKEYQIEHFFDLEAFVRFLLIQSNVNEQIKLQKETPESANAWLMDSLSPMFAGEERKLQFNAYSWYLERGK